MSRNLLRSRFAAALAGLLLLGGCAALDRTDAESELLTEVRQALSNDPELNTARVTVTERDGVIVIGGFADSLEDIDEIRGAVESVDGVASVENNVIVQTGS